MITIIITITPKIIPMIAPTLILESPKNLFYIIITFLYIFFKLFYIFRDMIVYFLTFLPYWTPSSYLRNTAAKQNDAA